MKEMRLEIDRLEIDYGDGPVVRDVSFVVEPGSCVVLVGGNGSGKTSIINAVSGLVGYRGHVCVNGCRLEGMSVFERARNGIGRTFQRPRVLHSCSTLDNILLGGIIDTFVALKPGHKESFKEKWDASIRSAESIVEKLEIEHLKEKKASALSFGQRKLVGLARALLADARLLLLDEPADGLSRANLARVAEVIQEKRKHGCALLVSSHQEKVIKTGTEVVKLEG